MEKEIEILKTKLKILKWINKKYTNEKITKEIKKIEKEMEEWKKANKEIWKE